MPTLTPHEKQVLTLAGKNYHHESNRERVVWDTLGVNMTVFWAEVRELIQSEAALAYDPLLTNRLRRRLHRWSVPAQPVVGFERGWLSA